MLDSSDTLPNGPRGVDEGKGSRREGKDVSGESSGVTGVEGDGGISLCEGIPVALTKTGEGVLGAGNIREGVLGAGNVSEGVLGAGNVSEGLLGAGNVSEGVLGAGNVSEGVLGAGNISEGVLVSVEVVLGNSSTSAVMLVSMVMIVSAKGFPPGWVKVMVPEKPDAEKDTDT